MSTIVKFFVAPGHETAAAVVAGGPGRAAESLEYGNFDAEEALIEWEGIVTGRSFGELVDAGVPEAVADAGAWEGPVVLAVSRALQDALAAADASRLAGIGEAWIRVRAEEGEVFDQEIVTGILGGLARLARGSGARDGHRLYCWMA
ncbi:MULTISPECIES: hypothetical protein [unclassified Streptomyces]|uniref:hypothetical protein n=1 Tax=unclassified Streptomyces TaxID=2593676 RepID=UPI00037F261E|nr:hypothetical protein [Streptomyces sp. BoleA5]MYX38794.1 hypothetical protein [Streptomyces sp. SID8377]